MKTNNMFTFLACIVLTACSGSSGDSATSIDNPTANGAQGLPTNGVNEFSDITGDINMLGVVRISVQQPGGPSFGVEDIFTYPSAKFTQLDTPLTTHALNLIATVEGENKTEGCNYYDDDLDWEVFNPNDFYPERTQAKNELEQIFDTYPKSNINAGAGLTLRTSDGTTIPMSPQRTSREPEIGSYREDLPDNWFGWPRTGTVIDIPGDTFPAVNSAVISTVEPIMNLSLTSIDGYVPPGSTASWTASQDSQSSIITFVAMGDGALVCHVPDTGSFTWPDELGKMSYADDFIVERTTFSYEQVDDALLIFSASVHTFPRAN